jgi:hypothetical protein
MSEQRAEGFWWVRMIYGVSTEERGIVLVGSNGQPLRYINALLADEWNPERMAVAEWGQYLGKTPDEMIMEVLANMQGLTTRPWKWAPPSGRSRRLPPGMSCSIVPAPSSGKAIEMLAEYDAAVEAARARIEAIQQENESLRAEVKRLKDAASLRWEYEVGL